jgi:hypothetical protein
MREEGLTIDASHNVVGKGDQYSLAKILGIWAAAAVPTGVLG